MTAGAGRGELYEESKGGHHAHDSKRRSQALETRNPPVKAGSRPTKRGSIKLAT
jgi:hypothetical protein